MTKVTESSYTGLKVNSAQVKSAVKAYVEEYNECSVADLYGRFKSEYDWAIKREGPAKAMVNWLRGLAINCAYTYYDIARLLAEWLQTSVEYQEDMIEKKGDELYWVLLGRAVESGKKEYEAKKVKAVEDDTEKAEIFESIMNEFAK